MDRRNFEGGGTIVQHKPRGSLSIASQGRACRKLGVSASPAVQKVKNEGNFVPILGISR